MTTTTHVDNLIAEVAMLRRNMWAAVDAWLGISDADKSPTKMHTFNVASQWRTCEGGMRTKEAELATLGVRHDDPRLGPDPLEGHR